MRLKEIIRQTAQGIHAAVIELETLPDHTCTNSYFVATVGGAHLNVIEQYTENQETV
jgi:REP element-mobilizing transposase RayT